MALLRRSSSARSNIHQLGAAKALDADLSGIPVEDTPHSHAAAARAVTLVRAGRAQLLMKGSLHTDELMHEVLAPATGLQTGRRVSHVYLMDVPRYPRPLLITDAAINIAPSLEDLRDIVQNAIDLAHVLGLAEPRVAILSAVETVTSKLQSTLNAAALARWLIGARSPALCWTARLPLTMPSVPRRPGRRD
jgi:phosphate acetyltransferase